MLQTVTTTQFIPIFNQAIEDTLKYVPEDSEYFWSMVNREFILITVVPNTTLVIR